MTALAAAKQITQYGHYLDGDLRAVGVATGVTIYHGAMITHSATGYGTPATTALTQPFGIADLEIWNDQQYTGTPIGTPTTWPNSIVNAGADDARKMVVRTGVFKMNNKAGDLVTRAMIGKAVYVEDDTTVMATSGGAKAGILRGFSDDGLPLVAIGLQ